MADLKVVNLDRMMVEELAVQMVEWLVALRDE